MGTVLNAGKNVRKGYRDANKKYKEAAREMSNGEIGLYYDDKIEVAEQTISEAIGANKNTQVQLVKNSKVRDEYIAMKDNLEQMRNKIQRVRTLN